MFARYLNEAAGLVKGGGIQPNWLPDGSSFWYAVGQPDQTVIYRVDPQANTTAPFFDADRLRAALTPLLGHAPPYRGLPFEAFAFVDEGVVQFSVEGRAFRLALEDYTLTAAPPAPEPSAEEIAWRTPRSFPWMIGVEGQEALSPDGRWLLGLEDYNLYLRSTHDGRRQRLTDDGTEAHMWDPVGAKWSPDGFKLIVRRFDLRAMRRVPIVHWLPLAEDVEFMRWGRAGQAMWQVDLFVLDVLTGRRVRLEMGDGRDCYLNAVGWLPDGSEALVARMDRECRRFDLMAAHPQTGATRIILTETQETALNIGPFEALPLTPLADGRRFIWLSERDGWSHLYLYDISGSLLARLTAGAFPVAEVVAVDEANDWVYFSALGQPTPYDLQLYRARLSGGELTQLTTARGAHRAQFSPSKAFFVDTHSAPDRPPSTDLYSADGQCLQTLERASIDALRAELKWQPPEEFWVKASDGQTDLRGLLYKPHDFDPQKRYPVVEYIYAGPHTFDVPITFGARWDLAALAQAGFVVYVVDGRGNMGRGKAYQDVGYGRMGQHEIPDHVAALQQLAGQRPYMDLSRVGIFGLSYGGYMTLRALVTAPEVYHVGVATCAPPELYEMAWAYVERFMGLPQHNKAGYDAGSVLAHIDRLRGKLLLVHGTNDVNAPFAAVIKTIDALVRANKPYDLLILPEQPHIYSGHSARYWQEAICRYFVEHLRPEGS